MANQIKENGHRGKNRRDAIMSVSETRGERVKAAFRLAMEKPAEEFRSNTEREHRKN